jgi:hypothetical protein
LQNQPDASDIALALGGSATISRDGWARCPCPSHGGTSNSLAIRGSGSRIYVKCFSHNCTPETILAAIERTLGIRIGPNFGLDALGRRPPHLNPRHGAEAEGEVDAEDEGENVDGVAGTSAACVVDGIDSGSSEERQRTANSFAAAACQLDAKGTPAARPQLTPGQTRARLEKICAQTTSASAGCLVHRYLTETRGIVLGVVRPVLRQHPGLYQRPVDLTQV